MAAKQRSMFDALKERLATPEPPAARTEGMTSPALAKGQAEGEPGESSPLMLSATERFLLGEGVELPDVGPPPSPHADLWMLGPAPTYQRKIAFTESVGARFGDLALTSRFCLDRWSESPAGFRWTLDPGPIEAVIPSARARDLLSGTFTRTQVGLGKLAMAEYGGDLDQAIIHAIREQMDLLGLDRYIPDEPQEAW